MQKWHILGKLILNSCSCCFTCWQGFWLQSSIKNDKDSFPGDPVVLVQAHFLCLLVEFISCSCRTEVSIFISGCQPRVALISVKKTDKQKLQLNRVRGPGEELPHLWQQQSWTGRRKIPLFSWQGLGQWKIMDSLLTLPSQVLFPLNKSILLHLLCGDLHVSSGCRKLNCSSLLILNKPVFFFLAGEITGSRFDLGQCFGDPYGDQRRLSTTLVANRCLYPQAEPVCSLICWLTLEFEGTPRSCSLCIWTLCRLYSESN